MMLKETGETHIDIAGEIVKIIVDDHIVGIENLKWRETENGGEELTLNEISEQLNTDRVIYVWAETGLSGRIYQFGNYMDGKWYEHGTTKGFA